MKKLLSTFLVAFLFMGSVLIHSQEPSHANAQSVSFSDITGHWAESDIKKAIQHGYIGGYPDGTFRPNATITRAEYATILSRVTKLENKNSHVMFPDIKGHWSQESVMKLAELGFIQASDYPNNFGADRSLTRYEMMKWLSNGLVKSEPSFEEALDNTKKTLLPTPEIFTGKIAESQIPYIALVKGTGISEGFEDGTFRLDKTTTRAEVTSILLRYADVEGTNARNYKALNELREVGTTGTNIESLTPYRYLKNNGIKNNFSVITDKQISLRNNIAIMKLHRMIVVDTANKGSGVYAKLFVKSISENMKDYYLIFNEISITSNSNKITVNSMNNSIESSLVSASRIKDDISTINHIPTIPLSNVSEFFSKGTTKKVWTMSVIDKNGTASYSLKSDNGDFVGIYK
ncbi:S-layer homology domain-containing protein [Paenibacillus sp. ACRRX]|uniref:S-layer homology domain-containing protein n=1 Tax=unclassified Paenibacillus TaxID=185978 RepID=UPI001EF573C5|nr:MULTISPECIES: S-layer homology domain-containing protein [unclassified Paenibacillus]MCG7409151.1 S-layer homology domain-containing protein [Paenibacillus sp. ACRRX]MDK8181855.1 S-layer homology domain-containing protein [Paenibacillus sp. UMB4589-SE434]